MPKTRTLLLLMLLAALLLSGCGGPQPDSSCAVEISCATVLDYPELEPALLELLPADGLLFSGSVDFATGESAYDVFSRALAEANIHFETAYDNSYFNAVANLYPGDGGDLSGWMYSVNGQGLMEAVNQYQVQPGDTLALQYTCDMGADLGISFDF